jgi:hypothetical protein
MEAVAGGERSFMKMLSGNEVAGKKLFDQMLYPLDAAREARCREYNPAEQDFDKAYRHLNVLPRDAVKRIRDRMEAGYPDASVVTIDKHLAPPLYEYRHAVFFKVLDYKAQRKYAMVPKMAAVKVCGRLYVALNAVCVFADAPIIVTIDG